MDKVRVRQILAAEAAYWEQKGDRPEPRNGEDAPTRAQQASTADPAGARTEERPSSRPAAA